MHCDCAHQIPREISIQTTWGQSTKYSVENTILFSTINARFPEWNKFRGAIYSGLATHDPLAQNLVFNMLQRGKMKIIPETCLLQIAHFASTDSGLSSPKMYVFRQVCRANADGERLFEAFHLSRKLRRLLKTIPKHYKLDLLYREWTKKIADCLSLICPPQLTLLCPCDAYDRSLSTVNRLYVRGLCCELLSRDSVRYETRPAYLPNAAQFEQWCFASKPEEAMDRIARLAEKIERKSEDAMLAVTQYISKGKYAKEVKNDEKWAQRQWHEDSSQIKEIYNVIQEMKYNKQVAEIGSQIYLSISKLGLNAAERDWFYMLNADQHD